MIRADAQIDRPGPAATNRAVQQSAAPGGAAASSRGWPSHRGGSREMATSAGGFNAGIISARFRPTGGRSHRRGARDQDGRLDQRRSSRSWRASTTGAGRSREWRIRASEMYETAADQIGGSFSAAVTFEARDPGHWATALPQASQKRFTALVNFFFRHPDQFRIQHLDRELVPPACGFMAVDANDERQKVAAGSTGGPRCHTPNTPISPRSTRPPDVARQQGTR